MNKQSATRQKLEFDADSESSQQNRSGLLARLGNLWNWFVESVIAVNEFKISAFKSRSGHVCWTIYDPNLGHRVFFNSEQEVRDYLDRSYHEADRRYYR